MRILSIDIGYGHVKVVYKETKIKQIKFATAISYCSHNTYGITDEDSCYEFDNQKFLVGEDALMNPIDIRDPELLMKYAPLLVAHAIKLTGIKDFDIITTGISILNYKYKKVLEENLKTFVVNNERFKFKKVIVNFQAQGVVYAENLQDQNVLVIDGGFLTLDAIPFNKGKIVPQGAYATRLGVSKIVENVQNEVIAITDVDWSLNEINDAIKAGYIKANGNTIDLKSIKQKAIAEYAEQFKATIKGKMKDYLARVDVVVVAGGLAHLLKDADNMPKNIIYANSPEYSNVLGYYKIAGGE